MEPVLAYIDAGTGSLLIQAIIAGIVAVPLFFRAQVARAAGRVRRALRRDQETPATER